MWLRRNNEEAAFDERLAANRCIATNLQHVVSVGLVHSRKERVRGGIHLRSTGEKKFHAGRCLQGVEGKCGGIDRHDAA